MHNACTCMAALKESDNTRRLYVTLLAAWLNPETSLMATVRMMLPEVAEYEVSPHKHFSGSINTKQKVLEAERLLGVRADLLSSRSQSGALLSYSFIWWGVKGEPSYAICNPELCFLQPYALKLILMTDLNQRAQFAVSSHPCMRPIERKRQGFLLGIRERTSLPDGKTERVGGGGEGTGSESESNRCRQREKCL